MLPKLQATAVFDWSWELGEPVVAPTIGLNNLGIEIDSVITDFLLPIAQQIRDTLKPVEPIIDALNGSRSLDATLAAAQAAAGGTRATLFQGHNS